MICRNSPTGGFFSVQITRLATIIFPCSIGPSNVGKIFIWELSRSFTFLKVPRSHARLSLLRSKQPSIFLTSTATTSCKLIWMLATPSAPLGCVVSFASKVTRFSRGVTSKHQNGALPRTLPCGNATCHSIKSPSGLRRLPPLRSCGFQASGISSFWRSCCISEKAAEPAVRSKSVYEYLERF